MSEKRHKSGYELLKEKYAALEAERDEWKAKWQQADAAKQDTVDKYNRKQEDYDYIMRSFKIDEMRIAFLLDHCPFWVRWMYRNQFEKGEKN